MMKRQSLILAFALMAMSSSVAQGSVRAGLSGWVADGDQRLYQGGVFLSIGGDPVLWSGQVLTGQAKIEDFGGLTTTRTDFNSSIAYRAIVDDEVSVSYVFGVKYRRYKFVLNQSDASEEVSLVAEQDAFGPIAGVSFRASPLFVRVVGAKIDKDMFIIPTLSYSIPFGRWGIIVGYHGEIGREKSINLENPTVHGFLLNIQLP